MGRQCRYLPTCSAYADEAISRHVRLGRRLDGPVAHLPLPSLGRHGGYDPVPPDLPGEPAGSPRGATATGAGGRAAVNRGIMRIMS